MPRNVSIDQIKAYMNEHGLKSKEAIEMLTKTSEFAEAFEHPVFQQNVADAVAILQSLLEKIWNETADDVDRADFRAYKRIVSIWTQRYKNHMEAVKTVTGEK